MQWTSRAVVRRVDPGSDCNCAGCGQPVKFKAATKVLQVICNVYEDGRWSRVEHFHLACYTSAGQPYGEAAA